MESPPPVLMANLGMADTLILMVLALVVFGPRRLPQIGRQIGKLMYEFRKASNDFKFQMEEELRQSEEADRRKKQEEERQRALAAAPPAGQIAETSAPAPESPIKPAEPEADAVPAGGYPYGNLADPGGVSPSGAESAPQPTSPGPAEPASRAAVGGLSEPRILPPSTGETVAAGRPGAQMQQQDLFAAPVRDASEPPEKIATAAPEAERSEPAAHHG